VLLVVVVVTEALEVGELGPASEGDGNLAVDLEVSVDMTPLDGALRVVLLDRGGQSSPDGPPEVAAGVAPRPYRTRVRPPVKGSNRELLATGPRTALYVRRIMWDQVVGQDRAVAMLQQAATRPVHAYLLVGPRGSGIETAARCFAALLIGAGGDDRVLRGRHPDVVEFRPVATMYSVERDVRAAILPAVHASPVETERKCVMLLEADRLNPESSNTLLKSIEEPPPRTIVILVAESAAEVLETIRSRCQRIDFGALGTDVLLAELERRGIDATQSQLAAGLAGGRLDRAVALSGPLRELRNAFADIPFRVDGTGATALGLAEGLSEVIKDTLTGLEGAQQAELDELEEEIDRRQYAPRTAQAMRKRVTDRQKREARRSRIDALLEGITAIESVYRDSLAAPVPAVNADRAPLSVDPVAAVKALDACREARASFEFNPNEVILLERLVLHLPAGAVSVPK
jgi:DNA polymerase III subunit delta'